MAAADHVTWLSLVSPGASFLTDCELTQPPVTSTHLSSSHSLFLEELGLEEDEKLGGLKFLILSG